MQMRKVVHISPPRRADWLVAAFPFLGSYELGILEGLREVAAARRWQIVPLTGGYEGPLRGMLATRRVAAVVADFLSEAWLASLGGRDVPAVQLAHSCVIPGMPNVAPDFSRIGREAGAALAGREIFFLYSVPGRAATDIAGGLGVPAARAFHAVSRMMLRDFLSRLPERAGLLAADVRLAADAILALRELGRGIPDEVAVFGVGDQTTESIRAGLEISSFDLPGRGVGESIGRIFAGEGTLSAAPAAILNERASSVAAGDGVERAWLYARNHLAEPLGVPDLCRIAGMSRRAFEVAVRERMGTSPARELERLRQSLAERLLAETTLPVHAIGAACGYPEPAAFTAAFRRWTGQPPTSRRQGGRR